MKYFVSIEGEEVEVTLEGGVATVGEYSVEAHAVEIEGTPVRMITLGTEVHRVVARRGATRGLYTLWLDGFRHEVEALDERAHTIRALSAATAGASGPQPLVAPMPGLIVRVSVSVGDEVQPGQGLIVMEAMKMENELRAATAGRVKSVLTQPGLAVEKGALLLEFDSP